MKAIVSVATIYVATIIACADGTRASTAAFDTPRFLGAGSCSASGCHGTPGAVGATGSEYSTWLTQDKHARAYEVLFQPRSQKMVKMLGRSNAHEDTLCLSCHVHSDVAKVAHRLPDSFRSDGVSCESCHGPGEKWLTEHFKPSWKQVSTEKKQTLGMHDTKSIGGRAKICVDCHVGSAAADVNHDFIAAGHPRLNFEFAAYHAGWTRHWPDRLDKDPAFGGRADFEGQAWVIGQLETAGAALHLLQACAADERKPWPEFAELDCYACHHDLQAKSWRQRASANKAGSLPWTSWYVAQVPTALSVDSDAKAAALVKHSLAKITSAIAGNANRRQIGASAHAAEHELARASSRQNSHEGLNLQRLYDAITADREDGKPQNWDEATQKFLALAAVHNAWTDEKDFVPAARLRPYILELREKLRFPGGFDPRVYAEGVSSLSPGFAQRTLGK